MGATIEIETTSELEARLHALSRSSGVPLKTLLRLILENGLEDVEDYYRAAAVVDRIERGEEEVISAEEMERRLDMDG